MCISNRSCAGTLAAQQSRTANRYLPRMAHSLFSRLEQPASAILTVRNLRLLEIKRAHPRGWSACEKRQTRFRSVRFCNVRLSLPVKRVVGRERTRSADPTPQALESGPETAPRPVAKGRGGLGTVGRPLLPDGREMPSTTTGKRHIPRKIAGHLHLPARELRGSARSIKRR